MSTEEKNLRDRRYGLLFRVRKSVRYHDYRRDHYTLLDSGIKVFGLVIASAVFSQNFNGMEWTKWFAIIFVLASSASLVFRFGYKAYLHDSLYKDFISIRKRIVNTEPINMHNLNQIESDLFDIESNELPIYSGLNRYCHNEVCRIDNRDDMIQPLKLYHKIFKNFFKFHNLPSVTR